MLTIEQSLSILDRSERGRDVAKALYDFLAGRASGLDMNGKMAVLSLIEESFINRPGSVFQALGDFVERGSAVSLDTRPDGPFKSGHGYGGEQL